MEHYPNGNIVGEIHCVPTPNGTLQVATLTISPLSSGVGQPDARELVFNCALSDPGCPGVADVAVTLTDGTMVEAYQSTTKIGSFTLDQFTSDGQLSGSMNLIMTKISGGPTFTIQGSVSAHLHDCGPVGSANDDPCTGTPG